jgi:hypothetical protein
MKSKVLWICGVLIAESLFIEGCVLMPRGDAISFAKADLAARAKERNVEISEVQVEEYREIEVMPGDRANGIQAYVVFDLYYASRCPGDEKWQTGRDGYAIRKVNGEWERDLGYYAGNTGTLDYTVCEPNQPHVTPTTSNW